ncbi:MAG: UV DNA damage repair endonuclease UvsE [Acidilobaceae archaeon]|nr:UV DNA damage repair endonuclease UvsE [Acidilobaceae archaeon]MCX8165066.1 UV DNA damage repair endonuclease UvsE [Acidilobaceae archaeon]MDW7974417.1 UV DNA damage repair endonuclease UvsE [Sulfolobales archaeon]
MGIGLGFFCSTSDNRLSTNHKFVLKNLSKERVMQTFARNYEDLLKLLELSRSMDLTVFRLGSDFVPFASHQRFERAWMEEILGFLKREGEAVRSFGVRLTMHPGQFVVLNSKEQRVIENSLRELKYHYDVLDALGLGKEAVVVVHVGGVFGDKRRAMKRLEEVIDENEWLKERLALENDERHYSAEEVLELSESLGLPMVFDYYHHVLNPSRLDLGRLISTWQGRVPEVHLSSPQAGGRFGEHGDYVRPEDFEALASLFEGERVDVIIEAKKKEKAIDRLLRELREKNSPSLRKIVGLRG